MGQFTPRAFLRKKDAYRRVFNTADGKEVLADLAVLCFAARTTVDKDPQQQAANEGRRQVWLRIQRMLHMEDREIMKLVETEMTNV